MPVRPTLPGFERTTLPNGVRVVTEEVPSVRSISVGVWVHAGSRDEAPREGGITHFIEHVVFKGTERRRGYQINQRMEAVGGYLNAFTAKEHTCFYARGLDEHLGRALDTCLDLVLHPTLPPREIEKEKDVVVEEIKMYEDNPEDHIFDHYEEVMYPGHPLGRPVIGTPESVRSFTRDDLSGYLDRHYVPNRLVVAVAGNVPHAAVARQVERLLDGFERDPRPLERQPANGYVPEDRTVARPIQQAHVVIGTRAYGSLDPRRTVVSLLNTVLGGGMSSRLHQNIRERYGYCYSVYSFANMMADAGDFGVYIGVDATKVDRARKLVVRELEKLAEAPVSPRMLERAKQQLKGSLMLSLESMSNRMMRLGRVELTFERYFTLDEVTAEIDAVTAEELRAAAEDLFKPERLSTIAFVPQN
jgi:predicted Zn-dependent peptidase